jgi:uncharacterized protein (TIGR03118 family)
MLREFRLLLLPAAACLLLAPLPSQAQYNQLNLVSDQAGVALTTDPNLVNAWGLSAPAGGPWWVSDNQTGLATLYNGSGVRQGLVVTVPPPAGVIGTAAPTGQVFNGVATDFAGSHFIFATEDGTISAWTSGTSAALKVDNSASGAVYKGLALANDGTSNHIYATNFNSGHIDVFNNSFAPVSLGASAFTDPSLPAGYAPFNIQTIGNKLYVTYAVQNGAKHDDVAGVGNGIVDVYSPTGVLLQRLATGSNAGGNVSQLNSPWGVALAPANFGHFSNDLLVGNFGDGTIDAFNPASGSFLGQMTDATGNVTAIDGLWGLAFGNGGNNGLTNELFFTAGPDGESHGLFGKITATPEPSTWATGLIGACSLLVFARRRRKK